MDANLTGRSWILLLLCNFIWAGNSVASKTLLAEVDWMQAAWLRTSSSSISFALGVLVFRLLLAKKLFTQSLPDFSKPKAWKWVALAGLLTFVGSPVFYAMSLVSGKAVEATWVVVLEPVILFTLAALFLREKIGPRRWVAFALASLGFLLFARIQPGSTATIDRVPFFWMLLGATCDGLFSIACRKAVDSGWKGMAVFGTATVVGLVVLSFGVFVWGHFPGFGTMHLRTWLALLWVGPLGTTLTFGYWVVILEKVPVTAMTLTLYLQPIFGSFLSYLLLNERLEPIQWAGTVLIVCAAFLSSGQRNVKKDLRLEKSRFYT